jgi:tetratricopeptide (TPR) repeat protein
VSYRALWVALGLGLLAACSRQPARPAVERFAILRFENLGEDSSVDWMGRAFAEIISGELAGTADLYAIPSARLHSLDGALGPRPVAAPGISGERSLALAAGANRIGYGEYRVRNGKLEARLTIEDPAIHKALSSIAVSGAAVDMVAVASALAQHVSGRIAPYGTRNPQVVKAYANVIESADLAAADTLQQAISTAPDFGPAYRELAQVKLRQQDRPGALAVLNQALARGGSIGAVERARTEFDAATLRGDRAAREQALIALTHADPADPVVWRDLGLTYMSRHQYAQAAASLRNALHIEPDDADSLNQLGYAAVYAGNLEEGLQALRHYQQLQPESANALDSLGDVNLVAGRLREAEDYYLAAGKKSPDFYAGVDFLKAAMARLMSGDTAGADDVARQYFAARTAAHDPLVEFRQVEWQWIGGRRKAAYQQMEKLAARPQREVAAHATAEMALWGLMMGNREAAAALAEKSLAMAVPTSAVTATVARFLAQPAASPAEWAARAERLAPNPAQATIRNTALAYALLLSKQYQAAAPVLEQLYGEGQPAGEGVPILLAWTYLETGRTAEAAALLRFNPTPPTAGLEPFTSFYFPRIYYLRGVAAERLGKSAEARDNYALFQKLSGPDPLL